MACELQLLTSSCLATLLLATWASPQCTASSQHGSQLLSGTEKEGKQEMQAWSLHPRITWSPRSSLITLYVSVFVCVRLLDVELTDFHRLADQRCLPTPNVTGGHYQAFPYGCWGSSSYSHSCVVTVLPTEPSPQAYIITFVVFYSSPGSLGLHSGQRNGDSYASSS